MQGTQGCRVRSPPSGRGPGLGWVGAVGYAGCRVPSVIGYPESLQGTHSRLAEGQVEARAGCWVAVVGYAGYRVPSVVGYPQVQGTQALLAGPGLGWLAVAGYAGCRVPSVAGYPQVQGTQALLAHGQVEARAGCWVAVVGYAGCRVPSVVGYPGVQGTQPPLGARARPGLGEGCRVRGLQGTQRCRVPRNRCRVPRIVAGYAGCRVRTLSPRLPKRWGDPYSALRPPVGHRRPL